MTADAIIQMLGGDSFVGRELDAPISTVNSWRRSGTIPRWWHKPLLELALRLHKPLSATDFPPRLRQAA